VTPAAELNVAVRGNRDAAGWTFLVSGELDLDTVPHLRSALAEAFAEPSVTWFWTFANSAASSSDC
jgi:hypothetical protein